MCPSAGRSRPTRSVVVQCSRRETLGRRRLCRRSRRGRRSEPLQGCLTSGRSFAGRSEHPGASPGGLGRRKEGLGGRLAAPRPQRERALVGPSRGRAPSSSGMVVVPWAAALRPPWGSPKTVRSVWATRSASGRRRRAASRSASATSRPRMFASRPCAPSSRPRSRGASCRRWPRRCICFTPLPLRPLRIWQHHGGPSRRIPVGAPSGAFADLRGMPTLRSSRPSTVGLRSTMCATPRRPA